jgi:hypothetical protein
LAKYISPDSLSRSDGKLNSVVLLPKKYKPGYEMLLVFARSARLHQLLLHGDPQQGRPGQLQAQSAVP